MKPRLMLVTCLILTFLSACQSLLPPPTATPTASQTNTPSPTATLTSTLTPTPTPIPTATRELTLEEKYGYLVAAGEKAVYEGRFFNDPFIPPGTKLTNMLFRATGETKREQTSLGAVASIQLVFRDNDGILRDLWMIYVGYDFDLNKDGKQFINGVGVHTPDELLNFVCPGTTIDAFVVWKKGTFRELPERCPPDSNPNFAGMCNSLQQEAYRRSGQDAEELKRLVEGKAVESSDFRLVPFYLSIKHGALTLSRVG
jgi:hypothetical protein